ncbi:MAG: Tyrosine recombinase XerC [Legionellaceae bacterium]
MMNKTLVEHPHLPNALSLTRHYQQAATSDNTRRAYQADIRHFEKWGGKLPATTEMVLRYLQTFAPELNPRTLSRRLVAIKQWHIYQQFPDPTATPEVSKTLTGITRLHGKPAKKAKPLLPEHLIKIVDYLTKQSTLKARRDNALLQMGFLGAFRRSELVAITVEDITWHQEGIEILIPQSKTDAARVGQYCVIPYGNNQLCAISALKVWLEKANITQGAIFRRIYRNEAISHTAISDNVVNHLIREYGNIVGIENFEALSSHSLRRGLATSASRDGVSIAAIMRQGRWKEVSTIMEYIEAAQRFDENAAGLVLKKINSIE